MNLTQSRSNKIFLLQVKYWFLLIAIFTSIDLSAKVPHPLEIQNLAWSTQDSLVIKKRTSKRKFIVRKEQKIKIWVGEQKVKGTFVEVKNDTLTISKKGAILKYNIHDISKIKIYRNLVRNIIGGGLQIWGGAIFVAGFAPIINWGTAGLFFSVPSWAVGFGIYKIGDLVSGNRKFNLEKKWQIN